MKMGLWIILAEFYTMYPPEQDKKTTTTSPLVSVPHGVNH